LFPGTGSGFVTKEPIMFDIVRNIKSYPPMALGGAVVWGVMEFVALRRAQLVVRARRRKRVATGASAAARA
jgi:hypothetical protein